MILFVFLILLLAAYGAEFSGAGFHGDYLDRDRIQPMKGIFLLLVFASHFVQYVSLKGVWDGPYFEVRRYLGQMVVVPFLFFSGYGIGLSVEARGRDYVRRLPRHRILKVLLQFDLAVVLFLILRYCLGSTYGLRRIVLTLAGWEGIGNSNWYIFAILWLYIASYLSFLLFSRKKLPALCCLSLLSAAFVIIMSRFKEGYWYNTVFAYTAGVWFACFRESIQKAIFRGNRSYLLTLGLSLSCFLFFRAHWNRIAVYEAAAVAFALVTVLVMAKIRVRSPLLAYCGEHLFSLFILQRLPMIALDGSFLEQIPWLYFSVCLFLTFLLSAAFDRLVAKLGL